MAEGTRLWLQVDIRKKPSSKKKIEVKRFKERKAYKK